LPTLSLFTFDHLSDPEKDGNWLAQLSEDPSFRETLADIVDIPPFTFGVWVLWRRLRLRCWRGERWRLRIRGLDFWEGYISLYLYTISAGRCMVT
jgi:hypothetical protein